MEQAQEKPIKILMIEDDPEFAELVSEYLAQFNMQVTNYEDPFLGVSAGVQNYDLLLLDLTLPGMDGLEVCEEVVRKYRIPIIISSARNDVEDKVKSLHIGADDYLPKPYDPKELHARILSLLRRYNKGAQPQNIPPSPYEIRGDTIYYQGKALQLTPAEFDILSQLIRKQGMALSREQLINQSRVMSDSSQKSLDVIISKIRAKLGDPKAIQAVRGVGYKLV
ncbi:response regulator transcription factor [Nitratifractor salsuginis]|uniref:Two component transcriptional regulator, winged helix family n=1 Tax=Nitratifractor salsuginis (strain DSM 16511 / JCM 12458 / E9I37-1) TaxID=749222 RepID=E6X101_NITSE|nr:response regulator transcription factor [Nitratifractor salsuginis]ADV45804.1 two component transcriptional regulator, winged helix family [Nitratifractor salsuginis DSM 16511]